MSLKNGARFFMVLITLLVLQPKWAWSGEGAGPPEGGPGGGPGGGGDKKQGDANTDRTLKPEEDDFSGTPFTEYGEFNQAREEDADAKFFQFGRFFGVSLGTGFEAVTGNRGALWQGGFPLFDFKVHYWFDFHLALDLGLYTAYQFYNTTALSLGHVDVNLLSVYLSIKYYFDTKDLSSAITFASPYVILGVGAYSKTENSAAQNTQTTQNSLGVNFGAGLEFTLSPRKTFLALEARGHVVTFQDTYTTSFSGVGLSDLSGLFITLTGSILFCW